MFGFNAVPGFAPPSAAWRRLALAWLTGLAVGAANAGEFKVVGGVGFDWLKPEEAQCRVIRLRDLDGFQRCEFHASGAAFGLQGAYHQCRASPSSEYLIYANRAQCLKALATMRANAP
ncbi:hypothetical protein [Inhella gelatinilytica]|uniref:Uncharacterized protein n=1 Tax=Inhella gelatinilytica TaxID=2795030 RepID=A0A931IXY7_9BURK|nr:hypothetical protein [Inhella gelatinilytica]MBH9553065.1 hypothetical protein [Inhella gelatinilytica]